MNKAIAALRDNGIADSEIVTLNYNLYPKYSYTETETPRINGYEARNEIRVTVRNLNATGKIIDVVVRNGINQVQNIRFYVENSAATSTCL